MAPQLILLKVDYAKDGIKRNFFPAVTRRLQIYWLSQEDVPDSNSAAAGKLTIQVFSQF